MRSLFRQFDTRVDTQAWPISTGPFVVFAYEKKLMKNNIRSLSRNRDGPLIFHMRDGPPIETGPPGAIRQTCGPPRFLSDSGPPKTTGPPMEWLVRKKSLKKYLKILKDSSGKTKEKT